MAAEPVSIFSARIDPAGTLAALRHARSDVVIESDVDVDVDVDGHATDDTSWCRASVRVDADRNITIVHSRSRYLGPTWRGELIELRDRIVSVPPNRHRAELIRAAAGLRFAVDVDSPVLIDMDRASQGRDMVMAIAGQLDGLIVTPSCIRDPQGRVLAGSVADPGARVPAGGATMPSSEMVNPSDQRLPESPRPQRVARRALAMAAVSSRAFLEQMDPKADTELERVKLHAWVDAVDIDDELEPEEWRAIQTKSHQLDEDRAVDAAWRFEGLTVLAWALGRAEVPLDHELVDAATLFPAVGFLDLDVAREMVDGARLRPVDEICDLCDRLEILLEQLRGMRRHKREVELNRTARASYAAHFAAAGLLSSPAGGAGGTSTACGRQASLASVAEVAQVENIVMERLVAARWLLEGGVYSHVTV